MQVGKKEQHFHYVSFFPPLSLSLILSCYVRLEHVLQTLIAQPEIAWLSPFVAVDPQVLPT